MSVLLEHGVLETFDFTDPSDYTTQEGGLSLFIMPASSPGVKTPSNIDPVTGDITYTTSGNGPERHGFAKLAITDGVTTTYFPIPLPGVVRLECLDTESFTFVQSSHDLLAILPFNGRDGLPIALQGGYGPLRAPSLQGGA